MSDTTMINGLIYFISFGPSTQIVVRYSHSDACYHYFFEVLHYWNGYETFRPSHKRNDLDQPIDENCVRGGIEEIRPASLAEKRTLLNKAIEHNTI
jgi:hypothetical protein